MTTSARETYLATEVLTAPPQKLHLLLVEAAIRACEKARAFWQQKKDPQATEALIRAQEIMSELVAGLNRQADPQLVRRVASLYLFIYRNLLEAGFLRDDKKLENALRVLREERITWQLVCQQIAEHSSPSNPGGPACAAEKSPASQPASLGSSVPLPPAGPDGAAPPAHIPFSLDA